MIFEVGKYYRHTTGKEISIICEADTTMFGKTLIAEEAGDIKFVAVGGDESHSVNWTEITKEEWMKNFSV